MITLKSDQLRFNFPEIGEELPRLVEGYIQSTLPRLLAEDRAEVVAGIQSRWGFRTATEGRRNAAIQKILEATPAEIEAALREECLNKSDYYGEELASVGIEFQRTLRIPDDGKVYPLPAGLGRFPLRHVDDFADNLSASWLQRGGVMMPMHQSEALWICFAARYPFAVKVAAGKINAVTGEGWTSGLQRDPQNYLVLPDQPWLDGFAVSKGIIRQFVAMPLGDGSSVEEQLTGKADVGGIQLQVFPMKAETWFRKKLARRFPSKLEDLLENLVGAWIFASDTMACACFAAPPCPQDAMGLGAGGTMRQEIYEDFNDLEDWDTESATRCFVHLCNSQAWRQITGSNPPQPPLTAKEYARAHIPWFDYYRDDQSALSGSKILAGVKSVAQMWKSKNSQSLPGEAPIKPETIIQYGNTRRPEEVREWAEP